MDPDVSLLQQGPVEGAKLRAISLGAGVQSTTMALMAAAGEITPMPDCAIFADTQWEPAAVYEHLGKLTAALPFPVYKVTAGDIRAGILAKQNTAGGRFASVPWFVRNPDGSRGMGRRQCTREFKMEPIAKEQRRLMGYLKGQRIPVGSVECWIGISTDEIARMKPAWNKWQVNRWPLIELGMTRKACLAWLEQHGWNAPRSACIGCPFHSDEEWRHLKNNEPEAWKDAVMIDGLILEPMRETKGEQLMHQKRIPLEDVDLSTAKEKGQDGLFDGFNQECEGMCGV